MALKYLDKACQLCVDGGIVIGLMPIGNDTLVRTINNEQKQLRRSILNGNRLLATMELPLEIFNLDKTKGTSNPSALVVIRVGTAHRDEDLVWHAMWKQDARRHKNGTGRIADSRVLRREQRDSLDDLWGDVKSAWVDAFRNRLIIPLNDYPTPGNEPLFGASYQSILDKDEEGNWVGDWIASAGIPSPESSVSSRNFWSI